MAQVINLYQLFFMPEEIKLRAERQVLIPVKKNVRKQGERNQPLQDYRFEKPKYENLSINKTEAHRW